MNIKERLIGKAMRIWSVYNLSKLRNRFHGRRGFVIGNGPSLKTSDLDMLHSEVTIASNRIYLAFQDTSWRPTFYTNVSTLQVPKYKNEILKHFQRIYGSNGIEKTLNFSAIVWRNLGRVAPSISKEICFSNNLTHGAFGGCTVTYDNLQFAAHLGLNPIYILGCDHFYEGQPENTTPNSILLATKKCDHFHPNYRSSGETINPAQIDIMTTAYSHARQYAVLTGMKIFNTTRGGYLEVFPRVDFDSLFSRTI